MLYVVYFHFLQLDVTVSYDRYHNYCYKHQCCSNEHWRTRFVWKIKKMIYVQINIGKSKFLHVVPQGLAPARKNMILVPILLNRGWHNGGPCFFVLFYHNISTHFHGSFDQSSFYVTHGGSSRSICDYLL